MTLKFLQIVVYVFFLGQFAISQSESNYSFENSRIQRSNISKIQQYYGEKTMEKQDWKTLDSLSSLVYLPYLRYEINVVYFSIYDKTGPMEKGAEYYKKVVLQGCLFDGSANRKYASFFDYDSLIEVRNSQIDTNLLNFFNRWYRELIVFDSNGMVIFKRTDSIFISELDSLVKKHGKWPGIKERGSIHKYNGKTFYPTILVRLMSEKEANYYYHLIAKECEQGNERWTIAQNIATQIVSTSKYNDRFYKIRNQVFEREDSFTDNHFASHYKLGLHYIIRRNTWGNKHINIYPTELWGGSNYNSKLTELIDMLVERGIPYESINIMHEIIPMDENEQIANDYFFVFEIVDQE